MTSFTITIFMILFAIFASVTAAPTSFQQRDVFVPPVTYPHAKTVWRIGEKHNVTWDITNPPPHITNDKGMVVLSRGGRLLDLDSPLASGFNIMDGRVVVQVPDVPPANDYSIVVFGDSGNNGANFTITR